MEKEVYEDLLILIQDTTGVREHVAGAVFIMQVCVRRVCSLDVRG